MPLAIAGSRTIYFAHVPKAGGSSVEYYMHQRFGDLSLRSITAKGRVSRFEPGPFSTVMTSPNHLVWQDARFFLPRTVDLSFALVREPLARIVSQYRFQKPHSKASGLDFSTWLRVVLRAAALDPRIYGNHIRPQVDFLSEDMEAFRLEDGLDRIVAWMDERLGETAPGIEMGHIQKSAKVSVEPTREDVALVARFYAADYDRFGYAPPDPAAYPPDRLAPLRGLVARPIARAVVLNRYRKWMR